MEGREMAEMVMKAHKVSKGKASGEALVSKSPVSFLGGINPETGVVVEKGHELEGKNVSGKVLVFPVGKGSTAGSFQLYELACCQNAPKAIINLRADPVIAIGAIISKIPMVDQLDKNAIEAIKTGDLVEVDADQGTVRVRPRSP
jgi:uncharacterized protein